MDKKELYVGTSPVQAAASDISGSYVDLLGESFYCIHNYDQMQPFFMSLVSGSDHWMFISSTGGLTAGRANAESALFPYYTDDKVAENYPNTGHVAMLRVTRADKTYLWEPFSTRFDGLYRIERNLYKNILGNKLVFEEINHDLGLRYRYAWRTSEKYGFVKTVWVQNDAQDACSVGLVDGLQNLLPYGATSSMQNIFSNLLNAYKRNELESQTGLGIFGLSSTMTDLAEPSEALKATTVWQLGLKEVSYLLSTQQLDAFRRGADVVQETDIRGMRGAYLARADFELAPGAERSWHLVADVNQDGVQVAALLHQLRSQPDLLQANLMGDIETSSQELCRIIARADGLQLSANQSSSAHHLANVMFNVMRGGIFADNYTMERADLLDFVRQRNKPVLEEQSAFFENLPEKIDYNNLIEKATSSGAADLERLSYEYLPLTFSRRHGDPSRPWNRFSINIKKPDGTQRLDYQGNWRDIFQNWEPLAWSYPGFVEGMICKFLNATTADGYNPYRITRDGIEWETPNPDDPWANIGYWNDHQIIYLEKLLEISQRFHPQRLKALIMRQVFSHANVPYRIKEYATLLDDPYNTIGFDWQLESEIEAKVAAMGTDAKLVTDGAGHVVHVNMVEKLLSLLLAKLSNLVPEGGIWLNTQRPEWNDANNALVGKGLSVVTLGYLRRFIVFLEQIVGADAPKSLEVSREVARFFADIHDALREFAPLLASSFSDRQRKQFMDVLGQAGSDFRTSYYEHGFSGHFTNLKKETLLSFLELAQHYVEHSLRANCRADALYHAYNVIHLSENAARIGHLDEMLEGQVSILSSGMLSGVESLELLDSLRHSRLYRADQHSYILYPDRDLPGFLRKNHIDESHVSGSRLIARLIEDNDTRLITRDVNGFYHFSGAFRNAKDVKKALSELREQDIYRELVDAETETVLQLFESTFNHHAFTGRSGSFFAYEGLGSIYWHMISKLLLAVQETYLRVPENAEPQDVLSRLSAAYYDIRSGLGYNKSPDVYGAFPTDPYSHTPAGQGAKQPGMTGQVKEEILTRLGELGLFVEDGVITFNPTLLKADEFTSQPEVFHYVDVQDNERTLDLPTGSLAFTFCQVPVVIRSGSNADLEICYADGQVTTVAAEPDGCFRLDSQVSQHIFERGNQIEKITFSTPK